MNSVHPLPESSSYPRGLPENDIKRMLSSVFQLIDQPPPPTLREILAAYRTKGDGDREMLLAMLNAKAAEDQRIAALATLHRSVLDVQQASETMPPPRANSSYNYPTPSFTQSPPLCEQRSSRRNQYPRASSRSRSPPRVHSHILPPRDQPMYHPEPPRKRHRGSNSPPLTHAGAYESHPGSQHEQFPPSPYSSSDRSDSAEYSPRSRQSMAIGSLLSSGPSKEMKGDIQDRE